MPLNYLFDGVKRAFFFLLYLGAWDAVECNTARQWAIVCSDKVWKCVDAPSFVFVISCCIHFYMEHHYHSIYLHHISHQPYRHHHTAHRHVTRNWLTLCALINWKKIKRLLTIINHHKLPHLFSSRQNSSQSRSRRADHNVSILVLPLCPNKNRKIPLLHIIELTRKARQTVSLRCLILGFFLSKTRPYYRLGLVLTIVLF